MLNWILLILLLIILVILLTWAFSKVFGRGEQTPASTNFEDTTEANRHAVGSGRINDIQFDVVARGYNQPQVDDVISHLQWQLEQARGNAAVQNTTPAPGIVDTEPQPADEEVQNRVV